jgi:AcrR family transcriptional regulator
MKEPLRQRKKTRTRRAIVDTAARLFKKKGFDSTTLEEIAEAADIHKQTVLRYFNSKEEIAFARRIKLFENFEEALATREGTVLAYWRRYITDTSAAAMKSGELTEWFEFIDSDTRLFAFQLRLNERYQEALAAAISAEDGVDPQTDVFARSVAALLVSGNTNVARMTIRNGDSEHLSANTLRVIDFAEELERDPANITKAPRAKA